MAKMSSFISSTLAIMLLMVLLVAPTAWGLALEFSTDFTANVTTGEDLTFRGFENIPENPPGLTTITFAEWPTFPPLANQGISAGLLKFGPKAINSLHIHPRASELFTVFSGTLLAGIVDTNNKLYTSVLRTGNSFVFPIGLMHFQINLNDEPATALAAFSNSNGGRVSIPRAIFNSEPHIDVSFLETALDLDAKTVERLFLNQFPVDG